MESLGHYRAAAIFYADAVRLTPQDPGLVFMAAALPLTLPLQGKLQEAWEYVSHQLEQIPHAVTYAIASLLCFHRAAVETGTVRTGLIEQQVAFVDQAQAAYVKLPESQQQFEEVRALMALGFEAAALGLLRLGDSSRARAMCDAALAFDSNKPSSWIVRGFVTYPEPSAVAAFTKAAELGAESCFAYYYLAHHSLSKDDFRSGLHWTEEAIRRGQRLPAAIKSQLYGWLAICQANLAAAPEEVEAAFRTALEIDPTNEEASHNYRLFLGSVGGRAAAMPVWESGHIRGMEELFVAEQEVRLVKSFRGSPYPRELLLVG